MSDNIRITLRMPRETVAELASAAVSISVAAGIRLTPSRLARIVLTDYLRRRSEREEQRRSEDAGERNDLAVDYAASLPQSMAPANRKAINNRV